MRINGLESDRIRNSTFIMTINFQNCFDSRYFSAAFGHLSFEDALQ